MLKRTDAISVLHRRWSRRMRVAYACFSIAGCMVFAAIAVRAGWSTALLPWVSAICFTTAYLVPTISRADVVSYLDRTRPELQESSWLLLKYFEELSPLEQLQQARIAAIIQDDVARPRRIDRLVITGALSVIVSLAMYFIALNYAPHLGDTAAKAIPGVETKIPNGVSQARLTITPPSYTALKARNQSDFNLRVEEGGAVEWNISTKNAAGFVELLFNDKSVLKLSPDPSNKHWKAGKQFNTPGFYQVIVDSVSSGPYLVESVKDRPVQITVHLPKPSTVIEPGRPQRTGVDVSLHDDYGVRNAFISATVSSGNGEAVKFRKVQLAFAGFSAGAKDYRLGTGINLAALGMKSGDELYFYIGATDSHGQASASDMFIVRIEDTTELMSIEGLAKGLDIKPQLFRSQRQIIIETEQLLRDRDTVSRDYFRKKSGDLGIDQSMLRLRYGKFLGEETNAEVGAEAPASDNTMGEGSQSSDANDIIKAFTHEHDEAEDASFFDPQTRKQLHATLDEMWKAEIKLRIMDPQAALPYEYKALRLLKDLQQSQRVYVAKTGSRMPPLKPEKRLTGELDKIASPVSRMTVSAEDGNTQALRKAAGIIAHLNNGRTGPDDAQALARVEELIGLKAAEDPRGFLAAFEAMKRLRSVKRNEADFMIAGAAIEKMLQPAAASPMQTRHVPQKLSERYFGRLHE